MTEVFLMYPLGLESTGLLELRYWWPVIRAANTEWPSLPELEAEKVKGGIELRVPQEAIEVLRSALKVPTRMLVRSGWTQAGRLSELVPPKELVDAVSVAPSVCIHITQKSRKPVVERQLRAALSKELGKSIVKASEADDKGAAHVFVRWLDRDVQWSFDPMEKPIYRRGYRVESVAAPLRENLAAGFLLAEVLRQPLSHLRKTVLLDPFCGSGTFAIEATHLLTATNVRDGIDKTSIQQTQVD